MQLTDKQVQQFHEEGYLIFENLIHGEKLKAYQDLFDDLVERSLTVPLGIPHWTFEFGEDHKPIPGFLHKIQGVCVVEPKVLDLAQETEILDRVQTLVGPDIDVFGTKFFPKLPNGGTSVDWHQDNFYFGTNTDRIVSCGIYLQDADRENGCLRIVPKSHLSQAIVEHHRRPGAHGSWTEVDESKALNVEVPGGTVVFFSSNLLHGTYENRSNRPRYSTAWHYIPADLPLERFPRGGYEDRHIVRGN